MAATEACSNCGSTRWHTLGRWERFVAWAGTGPGTPPIRCEGCGASQSSGGWYRLSAHRPGAIARLQGLPRSWRLLRHARSWHPVPIFYAIVVGTAAVPGTVLALLTRRRWLAIAVPLGAFVGTFLLSVRTVLEPSNREFVRTLLDPVGTHRRQVELEVRALRAEGHHFPVVVPTDWDGHVRLIGVGVHRRTPDAPIHSLAVLAEQANDDHLPRMRIQILTPDDASSDDERVAQVAFAEEGVTEDGAGRIGTPVGHGDDDILVFQMPDPSPERLNELERSWRDATLLVDGEPVPGRLLVGRRVQVATAELDDHVLEITGHDVDLDGLSLRRVTDLEPLIAEFERDRSIGAH